MLAKTMLDVSFHPAELEASLPWHEQGDVFISDEEEEQILSNAYGVLAHIYRPPSPADQVAYEAWMSKFRQAFRPMEQLDEDYLLESDEGSWAVGSDEVELQMDPVPERAIFLEIPLGEALAV
jgi:hypothetical protein